MDKNLKICSLGSGSKGNSFVIYNSEDEAILIDGGFSCKMLMEKLETAKVNVGKIKAILLTHEHDDHAKGCKLFCNKLNIPLYATFVTSEYLSAKDKLPKKIIQFEAGEKFEIGNFKIEAFAVQHDAIDPVGFTVCFGDKKIGIATDLGELNRLSYKHLTNCHGLLLESNYDREMLYNSDRFIHLKRRISGSHGHLDNVDANNALKELIGDLTTFVMLVHLSRDCNNREIVNNLTLQHLKNYPKDDISIHIATQESVSDWFMI